MLTPIISASANISGLRSIAPSFFHALYKQIIFELTTLLPE